MHFTFSVSFPSQNIHYDSDYLLLNWNMKYITFLSANMLEKHINKHVKISVISAHQIQMDMTQYVFFFKTEMKQAVNCVHYG